MAELTSNPELGALPARSCDTARVASRSRAFSRESHPEAASDSLPDADLLSRTRAGEMEAFTVLVERHKNSLVNYLTRLVRCRDRAEDYAQESFVRVFKGKGNYEEQGNFGAYLYRIATNLVRSDERRRARWFALKPSLVAEIERRPASEPLPHASMLSDEAQDRVTAAIEGLPLTYRAPVVLREIEGWSYARIAETLSLREGTVKSRINRGKEKLRQALQEYWRGDV